MLRTIGIGPISTIGIGLTSITDTFDLSQGRIADVMAHFPITTWSSSQIKTLVFIYLTCKFVFPSISKQGSERDQDILLAYILINSALIINGLLEFSAIARAAGKPLIPQHDSPQRQKFEKNLYLLFRHIRNNGADIAMAFNYLPLVDIPAFSSITEWTSSLGALPKTAMILLTTLSLAALRFYLSMKEIADLRASSRSVLFRLPAFNTREFNQYSQIKFILDLIFQSLSIAVLTALTVTIIEDFMSGKVSQEAQIGFIFGLSALFALWRLCPDHPTFEKYRWPNIMSRWVQNYFQQVAINVIFPFLLLLDTITSFRGQSKGNMDNRTAAVLLSLFAMMALQLAAVSNKISHMANQTTGVLHKAIQWPNFVIEMSKALFTGFALTKGDPLSAAATAVIGFIGYLASTRPDLNLPNTGITKLLKAFADLNTGFFAAAMAVTLIPPLVNLGPLATIPTAAALGIPLAAITRVAEKRVDTQPAWQLGLDFTQASLLTAMLPLSAKHLLQPFKIDLPIAAAYGALAIPLFALGLRLLVAKLQHNLHRINSRVLLKELGQASNVMKTLTFIAATAALFADSKDTAITGLIPMFVGLGLSSALLFYTLQTAGGASFFGRAVPPAVINSAQHDDRTALVITSAV